jgi:hypothetical protein
MNVLPKTALARLVNGFTAGMVLSAIRTRMEARRRGMERDREFYRSFKAYCRANTLSRYCEDDWRTAADDDNLHPQVK